MVALFAVLALASSVTASAALLLLILFPLSSLVLALAVLVFGLAAAVGTSLNIVRVQPAAEANETSNDAAADEGAEDEKNGSSCASRVVF